MCCKAYTEWGKNEIAMQDADRGSSLGTVEDMMEKKAAVFDIGRFRNTDGPGIRTIIFFKGCPLRCQWCSNAFGLSPRPQLAVNPVRCTGCGKCEEVCPREVNGIDRGKLKIDFAKCNACGTCVVPCPAGARMITGREYTARELFQEAYKDMAFYRKGNGGVTLSGGEVLMHHEVAAETLRLCRKNYIHTCIETSAYGKWEHLEEIAKYCNLIFVDLKHIDSKRHQELTGAPNELILDNIRKLSDMSVQKHIKLIIRRPVIPGYNDEDEACADAARFIAKLECRPEINLIPYHNLGENKYEMIGERYKAGGMKMLGKRDPIMVRAEELTRRYAPDNRVSVGGEAIDLTENIL